MVSTDSTIASLIRAYKLLLLNGDYYLQGKNEQYKEFIEENLENMKRPFKKFLEEAYNFPVYGFYYFEKIFKVENGKILWEDFAPRHPKAHYRWWTETDPFVEQQLQYATNGLTTPRIPKDKLILFTYQQEGDNYEGRSILRPLKQQWIYKNKIMQIMAIAFEKYGIGIPNYTYTSADPKKMSNIASMLARLKGTDQSYILTPEGEKIEFLNNNGSALSAEMLKYIQQIDRNMAKSFLAMFMVSGDNGVGSNAKVSSEMDFFVLTIKSFADQVLCEVNKAIKELIDLNFTVTDKEDYPKMKVTDLDTIDSKAFAETIKILTETKVINPAEEGMNKYIRENLNLPEKTGIDPELEQKEEETKTREKAMTDYTIHGNKKLYMKEVGKNPEEVIDTLS
jgi:hypothetical protein